MEENGCYLMDIRLENYSRKRLNNRSVSPANRKSASA